MLPMMSGVGRLTQEGEAVSARGLKHCTEDGCAGDLVARGLCRKHYAAWYRVTPPALRPPAKNLKRLSPEERFTRRVDRRGPDDCWPWMGARHRSGHGQLFVSTERRRVQAHSYALELATGSPCPPEMECCHHCDNPPCCNPAHLYFGTRRQNVADMFARNRAQIGSARPNSRYTESQIVAIRERFAAGELLQVLADEHDTSTGYISRIVNGLAWKRAGGPITNRGHLGRPKNWSAA